MKKQLVVFMRFRASFHQIQTQILCWATYFVEKAFILSNEAFCHVENTIIMKSKAGSLPGPGGLSGWHSLSEHQAYCLGSNKARSDNLAFAVI